MKIHLSVLPDVLQTPQFGETVFVRRRRLPSALRKLHSYSFRLLKVAKHHYLESKSNKANKKIYYELIDYFDGVSQAIRRMPAMRPANQTSKNAAQTTRVPLPRARLGPPDSQHKSAAALDPFRLLFLNVLTAEN